MFKFLRPRGGGGVKSPNTWGQERGRRETVSQILVQVDNAGFLFRILLDKNINKRTNYIVGGIICLFYLILTNLKFNARIWSSNKIWTSTLNEKSF